jgi:lipopolysaccharide/colanic/teichoic acid biosynthesis glycosyltransferase
MYRTEETRSGEFEAWSLGEHHADLGNIERGTLAECAKRVFDVSVASTLLLILLPLLVIVAIGVLLSSRGPIFYSQPRAGKGGKPFRFYKFRSMIVCSEDFLTSFLHTNAEARAQWNSYQKLDFDPRITRFGAFLRRASLDELPQLWNVIKGDMSLVGPRPCLLEQRELYGPHWAYYCAVRPGLTGLWQVSGRNRLTYQQRVMLDAEYVRNRSILLDLTILLRTLKVVLFADGSR